MDILSWHCNNELHELSCNVQYTGKTSKSYDKQLDYLSELSYVNNHMGIYASCFNYGLCKLSCIIQQACKASGAHY